MSLSHQETILIGFEESVGIEIVRFELDWQIFWGLRDVKWSCFNLVLDQLIKKVWGESYGHDGKFLGLVVLVKNGVLVHELAILDGDWIFVEVGEIGSILIWGKLENIGTFFGVTFVID